MTKKQEEKRQVELVAIELRLIDLAQGAAGGYTVEDGQDEGPGIADSMGIPDWIRFVLAAKHTFEDPASTSEAPARAVAFDTRNFPAFADRFDVAAKHLHDYGARA